MYTIRLVAFPMGSIISAHTKDNVCLVFFLLYLVIKRFNYRTDFISVFLIFLRTKLDHTCYVCFKYK
jgi:hypothetical protein